jgi:hypothetical protein
VKPIAEKRQLWVRQRIHMEKPQEEGPPMETEDVGMVDRHSERAFVNHPQNKHSPFQPRSATNRKEIT